MKVLIKVNFQIPVSTRKIKVLRCLIISGILKRIFEVKEKIKDVERIFRKNLLVSAYLVTLKPFLEVLNILIVI